MSAEDSYYSDDDSNVSAYDQVYEANLTEAGFDTQDLQMHKQISSFHDQNNNIAED
jgi:hypothetical protein